MVGHGQPPALVTFVETQEWLHSDWSCRQYEVEHDNAGGRGRMQDLPSCLRRSITFDNGKEFAEHPTLTHGLRVDVYFADPYASWQRGTNENTNGLLRQYFAKGTDFTQVSHREVACVERSINERPRRRLNYRTPTEALAKHLCRN